MKNLKRHLPRKLFYSVLRSVERLDPDADEQTLSIADLVECRDCADSFDAEQFARQRLRHKKGVTIKLRK